MGQMAPDGGRQDRSEQEAGIRFLQAASHALHRPLHPELQLSGTFRSGHEYVPRAALREHEGAGMLVVNLSAAELGRIAMLGEAYDCTPGQLGVGLLSVMREFIESRVGSYLSERTQKGELFIGVSTYRTGSLRPAFGSVTSESFLRIAIPINRLSPDSKSVERAIDALNYTIERVRSLGGHDGYMMAREIFRLIPASEIEEATLPPAPECSEDELLGGGWHLPCCTLGEERLESELWAALEQRAFVAARRSAAHQAVSSRHPLFLESTFSIDLRLAACPEEMDLYRKLGISDPLDCLRRGLEEAAGSVRVRENDPLTNWLRIACSHTEEGTGYIHFHLDFASTREERGELRFERRMTLGHLVDILSSSGLRGVFRQESSH